MNVSMEKIDNVSARLIVSVVENDYQEKVTKEIFVPEMPENLLRWSCLYISAIGRTQIWGFGVSYRCANL